ncbi:hypothetical protein G7008_03475 [Pseudomonas psychrotolerans]|uniref:hypothetical protein n=1 Tax=Pseudomonas oryzihabitans TaxID=47885 RepID=UPI0015E2A616|nr:hypothetical protein [Pseudomonas psychrotolerans]MBA1179557.1 hypothetical protein [Pseudomonas psychrotolerans]MBA1212160.1 hypothetical protein [Pseudomonas psychrotolerans]
MMFTQEEYDDARRLAYDQGFHRGSGMHPAIQFTEAYIHVREQELAQPVKRERKAPAPRRPIGDFLGDGEGRGL